MPRDQTAAILDELPPSACFVYKILTYEGPLSQTDLADETRLAERTVRDACGRLKSRGLVESWSDPDDQRKTIYRAIPGTTDAESER